jgi:hypothetical protein
MEQISQRRSSASKHLHYNKTSDSIMRSCEASYHLNFIAICKSTRRERLLITSKVNNSIVWFSRMSILDLNVRDKQSYPTCALMVDVSLTVLHEDW